MNHPAKTTEFDSREFVVQDFSQDCFPDISQDYLARCLSEAGFSNSFVYVSATGRWMFWDGTRWQQDKKLRYMTAIRDFLQCVVSNFESWGILRNSQNDPRIQRMVDRKIKELGQASTIAAIESLARSNSDLKATPEQFDANLLQIGTPAGTVDLSTGALLPAERSHWITKQAAIPPAANSELAPIWLAFLNRIFNNDVELISFLQRAVGYAMTGCTTEHKLFFLYGTGRNGKSVFINTIFDILGDYARRSPSQTFLDSNNERHPTDLAMLAGARLVVGSELPPGKVWNETVLKDLTGGDRITARFMRQDYFEYIPQFTLILAGNHQPAFRGINEAIRSRVVLIPFSETIPESERDPMLSEKLKSEWPAIFRWMIEGAVMWQRSGLMVPDTVKLASADYLDGEDAIGEFIDENLFKVDSGGTTVGAVFDRFSRWQDSQGIHQKWTKRAMVKALVERGYRVETLTGGKKGYKFTGLKMCNFSE